MWARSCATRWAIARTAVSIVPSAGSRTESYAASAARASAALTRIGSISSPGRDASSSAAPRTICERITPLFPRAPRRAARATASTSSSRPRSSIGCPLIRSSSVSTARRVIAMLSPVSPSATGNTFRSLTSCRRLSSSAQACATARRKRTMLGSDMPMFYTPSRRRLRLRANSLLWRANGIPRNLRVRLDGAATAGGGPASPATRRHPTEPSARPRAAGHAAAGGGDRAGARDRPPSARAGQF